MKIIYIANIRLPTEKAHGHQIMKICESFGLMGIDLELFLPTRINKQFKEVNPFEYYQVKANFKIKRIRCFDPIFLLKAPKGIYIKFQSFFFVLSSFFYFLFKKNKEEYIFYTRDEYLLPLLQLLSKKVVWESHALPQNKNRYLKYLKDCWRIIVLTQGLKQELLELAVEQNRILVSPDGVDLKIFDINLNKSQAREKLNLPQNKVILGYTGSFKTKNIDKGITDILEALKIVNKNNSDIILVAVGGSPEHINYYQKIAQQENLKNEVLFLEKVSQDKLAIYQKSFDILLMPFPYNKHYADYMSPLKMFEYMAAKRPIIASDLPSIREILNEGNAFLVKPDSPKSLAQGIEKLLQSNVLSKRIARQAYQDVQNYTWQKRIENILNFIK